MMLSSELRNVMLRCLSPGDLLRLRVIFEHNHHSFLYPYRLCFQGCSKEIFDKCCRNLLPLIESSIHTLCLLDEDETPHQPELFLEHRFQLKQFCNLKWLVLYEIRSAQMLKKMMDEWTRLSQLGKLDLIKCHVENEDLDCRMIMNHIWILQICECRFDVSFKHEMHFNSPTVESTFLKNLIIAGISCRSSELKHLLERTRNLEYISVKINDDNIVDEPLSIPRSMHTSNFVSVSRHKQLQIFFLPLVIYAF